MSIIGAGILYTYEDQVLLLRDRDGFWEIPGGKVSGDETSDETQKREIIEELGSWWDGSFLWNIGIKEGDDVYAVSAYSLNEEKEPTLSEEHTASGWFSLDKIPRDTRSSSLAAIDRLNMRFDQVAKAIADGIFASPVWFENSCLFAMRISGTNFAIREGPDKVAPEITFRNPSLWTSESMLEAANGLPVVLQHPDTATLTDDSFANSIVGTIILPFVRNDELWGIARIVNRPVAEELIANQWSTSPGVIAGKDSPTSIRSDGGVFIYEDKPLLLDHLAICAQGVWDKGGPPTGIDTSFNGVDNMDKETLMKAADCLLSDLSSRRDNARKDDDDGLEKAISKASSLKGLLEGMDDEKKDASSPDLKEIASELAEIGKEYEENDAAEMPAVVAEKEVASHDADKDGELEEQIKAMASRGGATEKVAAPEGVVNSKDDVCAKDADDSPMLSMVKRMKAAGASNDDIMACIEAMGMNFKRGDEDSEKEDKKDACKDDEKDKRDEEATKEIERLKKDAAQARSEHAALLKRLNDIEGRTRLLSDEETNEISAITARADAVYSALGSKMPRYVNGELPEAFRRRLAKGLMEYSPVYKSADLNGLQGKNFDIAERQIYADAASFKPSVGSYKEPLRVVEERMSGGGTKKSYFGNPCKAFSKFIEA